MAISKEKLATLQNLFKEVNEGLTKRDFTEAFQAVFKQLVALEKKLIQRLDDKTGKVETLLTQHTKTLQSLEKQHSDTISKIKKDNEAGISNLKRFVVERVTDLFTKSGVDKKIQEIDDKIASVRDGADGKDASEERVVEEVLSKIEVPIPDPIDPKPLIEELKKELKDELRAEMQKVTSGIARGGSRGKIPIVKRINLTSQVDGATKTFTMPKDCTNVLGVWGTQFPITFDSADFTFAGRTLTLTDEVAAPETGQTLMALIEAQFYG